MEIEPTDDIFGVRVGSMSCPSGLGLLAAVNPWHNAEFSIEALHVPNRFVRLVSRDSEG